PGARLLGVDPLGVGGGPISSAMRLAPAAVRGYAANSKARVRLSNSECSNVDQTARAASHSTFIVLGASSRHLARSSTRTCVVQRRYAVVESRPLCLARERLFPVRDRYMVRPKSHTGGRDPMGHWQAGAKTAPTDTERH